MRNIYIGIDNGVTGSIGIVSSDGDAIQIKTPVKKEQDYIKSKTRIIKRIDFIALYEFLKQFKDDETVKNITCRLERPMINNRFFQTAISAARSMEATINVLELLQIPYDYIDSKEWQRYMFPKGTKDTKVASNTIGKRFFPTANIHSHEDFDGILIAEHMKRKDNNG
jgi:hypothetical protein